MSHYGAEVTAGFENLYQALCGLLRVVGGSFRYREERVNYHGRPGQFGLWILDGAFQLVRGK
ncbi:hypothetical protein U5922_011045 [Aquicoccus sp. G2-2]|uniref:hypothetical protein n=1 Tax=Aquicoccus sp. G2-2 TaxID=3092120 RepID=UPI002AE00EF5|nr:hypothetical protein [Aquicoccus sp. G2-2]MEA1113974.1 hypothetical protein [Aquicoccus sp. G2-2]